MQLENDELLFADEGEETHPVTNAVDPWLVLVVDDEPEVHAVTRMVLQDLIFESRPLHFIPAYSAAEARQHLTDETNDIAAILLDVVMETDQAGLELARWIRDIRHNRLVRIILRTGQPGQAPERKVVIDYDINDYKDKSELTAAKLTTSMLSALRSYRDLLTIERNRHGLAAILDTSSNLYRQRSVERFLPGILNGLASLLNIEVAGLVCLNSRADPALDRIYVSAARGRFAPCVGKSLSHIPERDIGAAVLDGFQRSDARLSDGTTIVRLGGERLRQAVVYFETGRALDAVEGQLVNLYFDKVDIGFENAYLYEQLERAEAASIYALAKLAEFKDDSTGAHVRRVCVYTKTIAHALKEREVFEQIIDDEFLHLIGLASVLHDVGKVGIPDDILKKPLDLTADELLTMRRHPTISSDILSEAAAMVEGRTYLSLGAEIALAHHEKFDGGGYPKQLAGDDIPLAARILAVADVFDALTTKRCYKEPWPIDKAVGLLQAESGKHFDPRIVDAFLNVLEQGRILPNEAEHVPPF